MKTKRIAILVTVNADWCIDDVAMAIEARYGLRQGATDAHVWESLADLDADRKAGLVADDGTDQGCEGCDGSGIRDNARPSCRIDTTGLTLVERCDSCAKYEDDLAAAVATGRPNPRWIKCSEDSRHAATDPVAADFQASLDALLP